MRTVNELCKESNMHTSGNNVSRRDHSPGVRYFRGGGGGAQDGPLP